MTIGLACLTGLIIVFLIKLLNIFNKRKFYKTDLALIGIFLSFIFWVCYMASLSSSLIAIDTITTTAGEITVMYGDFYDLQVYYPLVAFLFVLNMFLGIIESFSAVEFMVKEYTG